MTIPELAKEVDLALAKAKDTDDHEQIIENILHRWMSEVSVHPQRWLRLLVQTAEFYGRAVATDGDLAEAGELLMDTIDRITALPKSKLPPSPAFPEVPA